MATRNGGDGRLDIAFRTLSHRRRATEIAMCRCLTDHYYRSLLVLLLLAEAAAAQDRRDVKTRVGPPSDVYVRACHAGRR